jgi:cellulose synthase operon protein C
MSHRVRRAVLLLCLAPALGRAGLAEEWYLSRGRANLEIRSYAAAVEAYRHALAENPRSRDASRGVCLALLGNGDTDAAVAELDRHLARFPDDWALAFEQARILSWGRYAYRARDAIRYLRLGLERHEDPARRRDLARLLARDRATLPEALAELDRLLAASPRDRTLQDERLALLLWDPGRRAEAVAELRERHAAAPGDADVTLKLARLLAAERGTAAEAAGLYADLLGARPADPDLLLGHARALARAGQRDAARAAYDRALAARTSSDVRLERAELLSADPATRDAARADYEAVLRAQPGSRKARLGLARTLSARKETSRDAIRQYQAVLASAPGDAEAHRGLARAYAWNGEADRALAHGDAAARSGPVAPDVEETMRALRRGREPAAGGGARVLGQPGGAWALDRIAGFARGAAEPTPFTTSEVEAGLATARGPAGASAEGGFVRVEAEWRSGGALRLGGAGGWDGARRAGQLAGALRLGWSGTSVEGEVSVSRTPRLDSFRAYAGEVVGGRTVGAVSEDGVALRLARAAGATRLELTARAGALSGPVLSPVAVAALAGRGDRVLGRPGSVALSAGLLVRAIHHGRDASGLADADPLAPRVFSPPLEVDASPRLGLRRDAGLAGGFLVDAGPALQVVTGSRGGVRAGGDARAAAWTRLGERLRLRAEASAEQVAAAYARWTAGATAEVLFP